MQREVQRVVKVVIEVRTRADDEIHETAFHEFDHAAAEAGGGQRTGYREANGRLVLRREHLVRVDAARLPEPSGVEGLEAFVDQPRHVGAAARPEIPYRLAGQIAGAPCR